jgi:polar amino acid transport system permease protein
MSTDGAGEVVTASPAHPPLRRTGMSPRRRAQLIRYALYAGTIALLAFILVKADWATIQTAFFDPQVFADLFPEIITTAARNTIIFTAFGFTGGLIIGLVLALMRLSSIRPYRWAAAVYIEIFRGVPALVTLILIGFALPIAMKVKVPGDYGPGSLALAIVAGAYMAETIRAGIEAVPRGQMEAARSLGMGYGRSMVSIIIPQAFRIILPPLTNELVLLIKDTSLLFILGTTPQTLELAKYGRDAMSDTFNATPIVAVALIYLVITIPLTQLVAVLERRNKRSR